MNDSKIKTYSIKTFGCQANIADSNTISGVLEALGFEKPKDKEKQATLFSDLSPEEKKVVLLLREAMPRDDLIRAMKMPTPNANAILSIMEIKELIKEEMGEIKLA